MPGPSWIEYRLTLKIRPFINKEKGKRKKSGRNIGVRFLLAGTDSRSEGIEHQAAIEPAPETLPVETIIISFIMPASYEFF
jgi:hypothetical protein